MRSDYKKVYGIIVRYSVLLVLSFFAIPVFYYIFLPLTKYPAFYFMDIFYDAFLKGDSIFIGVNIIEIAGACVAGSAYYLLLILNLGTPRIKNHERVKAIAF
ncbi:MAG: pacearchaeosortase, partial [archaeon]|nr:pacearchaeosortase [archaeon]